MHCWRRRRRVAGIEDEQFPIMMRGWNCFLHRSSSETQNSFQNTKTEGQGYLQIKLVKIVAIAVHEGTNVKVKACQTIFVDWGSSDCQSKRLQAFRCPKCHHVLARRFKSTESCWRRLPLTRSRQKRVSSHTKRSCHRRIRKIFWPSKRSINQASVTNPSWGWCSRSPMQCSSSSSSNFSRQNFDMSYHCSIAAASSWIPAFRSGTFLNVLPKATSWWWWYQEQLFTCEKLVVGSEFHDIGIKLFWSSSSAGRRICSAIGGKNKNEKTFNVTVLESRDCTKGDAVSWHCSLLYWHCAEQNWWSIFFHSSIFYLSYTYIPACSNPSEHPQLLFMMISTTAAQEDEEAKSHVVHLLARIHDPTRRRRLLSDKLCDNMTLEQHLISA